MEPSSKDNDLKVALVIGSTGAVGQALLSELADQEIYDCIYGLQRRLSPVSNNYTRIVCDFEQLDEFKQCFHVKDVFCCLGASTEQNDVDSTFKRIDLAYVVKCAELARKAKVNNFVVVSAINTSQNSMLFNNRNISKMEMILHRIFDHSNTHLYICRPSVLLDQHSLRGRSHQWGSIMANQLSFIWQGPLKRYKPLTVNQLAKAMLLLTSCKTGFQCHVLENDQLHQLAAKSNHLFKQG